MPTCHLTMPGALSRPDPLPSTLDVTLDASERAFLRKLEAAGGRLFLETDADRRHAQACLRQGLAGPAGPDCRCFSISPKGRAYLARLRSAE